jgi:hypothetical protein
VLTDPTLMVTHASEMPGGSQIMNVPCYCPGSACACTTACACQISNCAGPELPFDSITNSTYQTSSTTNEVGIAEGFAAMIEVGVEVGGGIVLVGAVGLVLILFF